jgi:hypothetical protein
MMDLQFWTPWFLAGLVFLTVPFLLLLTKAQSTRTIPFSSVQFLRTVIEKASNSIEWKRLLLLVCRLLAVACLSVAFSLPFLTHSRAGMFASAQAHMIYVLDDSYSMAYTESNKSLFDRGREYIRESVRQNQNGRTRFSLYLYDHKLTPLVLKTTNTTQLISKLDAAAVSDEKSDYSSFAAFLDAQISRDDGMRTHVDIVSDFSIPDHGTVKQMESLPVDPQRHYRTNRVPIQPEHYKNLAIEDLRLPSRPFMAGMEEDLEASFRAYGIPVGTKVKFSLWIENNLAGTKESQISEFGAGVVSFRCRFPGQGVFPIRIEAEPDGLRLDDVRYAVAVVRSPVKILMIENGRYSYPFERPSYYFENALLSYDPEGTDTSAKLSGRWFDAAHLQVSDLGPVSFDAYDLIVMAGVTGMDPNDLSRLHSYVRNGGAVLFAPGKNYLPSDYKETGWTNFLGGTFAEAEASADGGRPYNFTSVAWQHPALQIFEDGHQGDLSKIPVRKYASFIPVDESRNPEVLLRIHSRPVFLVMHDGLGKMFLWTTTLNTDWNDFPKHPLYVPFLFEILKYGVFKGWENPGGIKAGQEILFRDSGQEKPIQVTVTDPRGEQTIIYGTPKNPVRKLIAPHTGIYEWSHSGDARAVRHLTAVNPDTNESIPDYMAMKNQSLARASHSQPADMKSFSTEKHFYYMPLFYAIFVLLFVESWLANRFYRPGWTQ